MFSLIVTLTSIALVAALALATVYYLRAPVEQASVGAVASAVLNQGQQIRASMEMYRAKNGGLPSGTDADIKTALVDGGFLSVVPTTPGQWSLVSGFAEVSGLSQEQCEAANAKLGVSGVPTCATPNLPASVCCSE